MWHNISSEKHRTIFANSFSLGVFYYITYIVELYPKAWRESQHVLEPTSVQQVPYAVLVIVDLTASLQKNYIEHTNNNQPKNDLLDYNQGHPYPRRNFHTSPDLLHPIPLILNGRNRCNNPSRASSQTRCLLRRYGFPFLASCRHQSALTYPYSLLPSSRGTWSLSDSPPLSSKIRLKDAS